jgi:tetratricopeptide (TPR) repeat protein
VIKKLLKKLLKLAFACAALAAIVLFAVPMLTGSAENARRSMGELASGHRYLLEGSYEEAILSFEQTLDIDEKSVTAYVGIALADVQLDRRDEAVETLKTGAEAIGGEKGELLTRFIDEIGGESGNDGQSESGGATGHKTDSEARVESGGEGLGGGEGDGSINIEIPSEIRDGILSDGQLGEIWNDVEALFGGTNSVSAGSEDGDGIAERLAAFMDRLFARIMPGAR